MALPAPFGAGAEPDEPGSRTARSRMAITAGQVTAAACRPVIDRPRIGPAVEEEDEARLARSTGSSVESRSGREPVLNKTTQSR